MKFGQLIEYNVTHVIHFFFKTHAGNESGRLVPFLFLLLKKSFIWGKSKRNSYSIIFSERFLKKLSMSFMLYAITWPNFIVWLLLLLEILDFMLIAIVSFPGCDVINFEMNFIFLTKPFFPTWLKKSEQKFKYLQNERSLWNKKQFPSL